VQSRAVPPRILSQGPTLGVGGGWVSTWRQRASDSGRCAVCVVSKWREDSRGQVKQARQVKSRERANLRAETRKARSVRLPVDTKLDFAAGTSKQPTAQPALPYAFFKPPQRVSSSLLPSEDPGRFGSLFPKKGWSDWV
jgi:hypothetical protein